MLQTAVSDVGELTAALANASIGHIRVAAGHYSLTAQLNVSRSVTIEAVEPGSVVLSATAVQAGARRVLLIVPAVADSVSLIGLNITGGEVAYPDYGAGISIIAGNVDLTHCAVYGNNADVRAALPVDASLAVLTWLRRCAVADGLACARAGRLSRGIACVLPLRSC